MSCAICEKRKEKRFCPAVHGRICPQCCGEKREITLDCPSDCVYLQQARQHELPRSLGELDQAALFLEIDIGEKFLYEHEHLLLGLNYALVKSARADRALVDADLIAALTAVTRTYETLANSGLYYEMPLSGTAQQALAVEVQNMIKEFREAEQSFACAGIHGSHRPQSYFRPTQVPRLCGLRKLPIRRGPIFNQIAG